MGKKSYKKLSKKKLKDYFYKISILKEQLTFQFELSDTKLAKELNTSKYQVLKIKNKLEIEKIISFDRKNNIVIINEKNKTDYIKFINLMILNYKKQYEIKKSIQLFEYRVRCINDFGSL